MLRRGGSDVVFGPPSRRHWVAGLAEGALDQVGVPGCASRAGDAPVLAGVIRHKRRTHLSTHRQGRERAMPRLSDRSVALIIQYARAAKAAWARLYVVLGPLIEGRT